MLSTYSAYLQCCKRPQDGEQGYWQTCTNIIKYDKQKASQGLIFDLPEPPLFASPTQRRCQRKAPEVLGPKEAQQAMKKGEAGEAEKLQMFSLDCMATHGYALLYSKTIISKFWCLLVSHRLLAHIITRSNATNHKKGTGTNSNSSGH